MMFMSRLAVPVRGHDISAPRCLITKSEHHGSGMQLCDVVMRIVAPHDSGERGGSRATGVRQLVFLGFRDADTGPASVSNYAVRDFLDLAEIVPFTGGRQRLPLATRGYLWPGTWSQSECFTL